MYTSAHTLSKKSARQQRNVFIWSSKENEITMGWHVDTDSPTSISTAYRWITTIVQTEDPTFTSESFALFPVDIRPSNVLTYAIKQRSDKALPRESQENIVPGDYGIYNEDGSKPSLPYIFPTQLSYATYEKGFKIHSVALSKKASLPSSIAERALARDKGCIFTVVSPASYTLAATFIFPPFLGYTLSESAVVAGQISNNVSLNRKYHDNPEACDLSEFMVVSNTLSGPRDVVDLFYDNKIGIDVDDNYRIVIFDGSTLQDAALNKHAHFVDGPDRPSDRFLHLHFQRCLIASACGGNAREDYEDQEIDLFMEDLGVYDDEVDPTDDRWTSPLGVEVHAYLVRQKTAELNMLVDMELKKTEELNMLMDMELKKAEDGPSSQL